MKKQVIVSSLILIASCKSAEPDRHKEYFLGSETSFALVMLSVDVLCVDPALIPQTPPIIKTKISLYKEYLEKKKNRTSQEELHLMKLKFVDSDGDFNNFIQDLIKNRASDS